MPGNNKKNKQKKQNKKNKSKAGGVVGQTGSQLDVLNSSALFMEDPKDDSRQKSSPVNLPAGFLVVPLPEAKAVPEDKKAQSELEQQFEAQFAQAEAQIEQAQDVVTKMPEFDVGSNLNAVVFAAMVKDAPEELPTFYRDKPEEYTFTRKAEPMNLLHISAYFGAVNMTKWLLSTGKFDIDEPTCNGKSALWFAIRYDNEPLISFKDHLQESNSAWVNRKSEVFRVLLLDHDANASFEPVEGLGGLWDILFELYDDLLKNNLQLHSYKFVAPLLDWDDNNFQKPTILQHGFNAPHDFHYKRLLSWTESSSSFLIPRIMEIISNKLSVFDLEAETNAIEIKMLGDTIKDLEESLSKSKEQSKSSAQSMSEVLVLEDKLEASQKSCKDLSVQLKKKDKEISKILKSAGESSELQVGLLKAQEEISEFKISSKTSVTKAEFDKLKQESDSFVKALEEQVDQFKSANKDLLTERSDLFRLRYSQASELEVLRQKSASLSENVATHSIEKEATGALLKEATGENRSLREKLQRLEVARSESMASREKVHRLEVLGSEGMALRERVKQLETISSQLKKMIAKTASDNAQKYNKRESELLAQIHSKNQQLSGKGQQLSEKDQMISYQQQQLQESQYKDQMISDLYSQLQAATTERDSAHYSASQTQIFADSLGQQLGDLTRSKSLPDSSSLVKMDRKYQEELSDLRCELLRAKSELSIAKFNLSKREKPEASGAGQEGKAARDGSGSFVMAAASDGVSCSGVEAGV